MDPNTAQERIVKMKSDFNTKLSVLKKEKDLLFKIFRKKLEEKKIEEIKNNILNN